MKTDYPPLRAMLTLLYSCLWIILMSTPVAARRGGGGSGSSKYKTAYACEGSQLGFSCPEGQLISLIRANYGRFSISICNEHGTLDWSVDCKSNRSYNVIRERISDDAVKYDTVDHVDHDDNVPARDHRASDAAVPKASAASRAAAHA